MSDHRLYSICDVPAGLFSSPFVAVNDRVALRRFVELVSSQPNPSEFKLFHICDFSPTTGSLLLGGVIAVPLEIRVLDLTGGEDGLKSAIDSYQIFEPKAVFDGLKAELAQLRGDNALFRKHFDEFLQAYPAKKGRFFK